MVNLLYFVYCLLYFFNKGDKLCFFYFLKYFLKNYKVFFGIFVDDFDDWCYIIELGDFCVVIKVVKLDFLSVKICSVNGLFFGDLLIICYFRDIYM